MPIQSFLTLIFFVFINVLQIQAKEIRGKVMDSETSFPIHKAEINAFGNSYFTNRSGDFVIPIPADEISGNLSISAEGFQAFELTVSLSGESNIELGIIFLDGDESLEVDDRFVIDNNELEANGTDLQVSSLLSAAWDPFGSVAGFNFGVTRFNARGLNQNHSSIHLNGVPFNNLSDGRFFWSLWGGLNDAFRTRNSQHGFNSTDFSPGGFSGTQDIDLRATSKRAGTRFTADVSNRTYQYRTMLSHNSGVQDNGWSYAFTVSRRWGSGGFIEGTYYDGYAYFASIDKRINNRHSLNLLAFASPTVRGRAGGSTQVVYDLLDNNFYNPNWGYQNGEVRNSREYRSHQPVFILTHDYSPTDLTTISTSAAFQTGKFGSTRLGWLEAADPRPDYYGNLPYDNQDLISSEDLEALTNQFSDPNVSQLDWEELYNINRERLYPIRNGDPSQTTVENISAYVIEEQRFDNTKAIINTNIIHQWAANIITNSGATVQYDRNHNFKVLDDLLGGSFYLDIDGFALRESSDVNFIQNDLANPNRLLTEGDRFGYDYNIDILNINAWNTIDLSFSRFDVSLSTMIAQTSFSRFGNVENGKFPGSGPGLHSLGRSDVTKFLHGSANLGGTFKINGRNYVYANARYTSRAPFARNAFESPITRNSIVQNLTTEKIYGGELGYVLRHPKLNARLTGFYIKSKDEIRSNSFFLQSIDNVISAFGNLITSGIDKVNYGLELGLDYKLTKTLELKYALALGEYYFDSRQDLAITIDNSGVPINYDRLSQSYLNNFNISGIPQIANTMELRYQNPNFWSVSLTASYFDDIYIEANPVRRTEELTQAIINVTDTPEYEGLPSDDLLTSIVEQEKFDSFFKVDIFARKSWKIGDYSLAANATVENLLNSRDIVTGGFEQFRFDLEGLDTQRWAPRYFYAFGLTYRAGITLSF